MSGLMIWQNKKVMTCTTPATPHTPKEPTRYLDGYVRSAEGLMLQQINRVNVLTRRNDERNINKLKLHTANWT